MVVKAGDIIEFKGISWNQDHWDFDYPSIITEPVIKYSNSGTSVETLIEDLAIELTFNNVVNEDISEEFAWRQWNFKRLKQVISERIRGKDTWKTKCREVVTQTLEFYNDEDGDLYFRVLKTTKN